MPFTTPLLAAARVRVSERNGIEMIAANPAGRKGVYILPWAGVRAFCNPTVHDTLLFQHLTRLTALDPRVVREGALTVALEGHAGRDAQAAAKQTIAADRIHLLQTHFLLLQGLIEQTEPGPGGHAITHAVDFDQRVSVVTQRIARDMQRSVEQISAAVAAVSAAFAPIGIGPYDRSARIPRLIERLEDTQAALSGWLKEDAEHDFGGLGSALAAAMRAAAKSGQAVVATTRVVLADPLALLQRCIADPLGIAVLAERGDWLLDGWERLCLLWQAAADLASRRPVLLEMAQGIPELPREAFGWTNPRVAIQVADQSVRVTGSDNGWRTSSAAFSLVERNERLRSMSL